MSPIKENPPSGDNEAESTGKKRQGIHSFVETMAISSTWLFSLAVIGTGIIAAVLFVYGFLLSLSGIYYLITEFSLDFHTVKDFLGISIQIIDMFLVATVFYLISLGLYELFIAKAPLPGWVEIRNLEDLKNKLLGLVVIALAVIFLGYALTLSTETSILELGAAVGIMIGAISVYLWTKH
ncbi:MAG: YqhA family protein [Methanoregula sp.]